MKFNLPNAFGFMGVGLLMEALQFLPSVSGVRKMWLLFMGGVLLAIGLIAVGRAAWLQVAPRLLVILQVLKPERADAGMPDVSPAVRLTS